MPGLGLHWRAAGYFAMHSLIIQHIHSRTSSGRDTPQIDGHLKALFLLGIMQNKLEHLQYPAILKPYSRKYLPA